VAVMPARIRKDNNRKFFMMSSLILLVGRAVVLKSYITA
jgi:hypothetical protein